MRIRQLSNINVVSLTHLFVIVMILFQSAKARSEVNLSCDKEQTYCLVLRKDLTVGDKIGFFYYGKLAAIGQVSEIYYDGQRRIEITKRFAPIYKTSEVKLIDASTSLSEPPSQENEGTGPVLNGEGVPEPVDVVRTLKDKAMGISGGSASFQFRDGVNGFEANAYSEYRIWKNMKYLLWLNYAYGNGDVTRDSLDARGYNFGTLSMHYIAIMPGLSATAFEDRGVALNLALAAGLGYLSAAIDDDKQMVSDPAYNLSLKNDFSGAARATTSILFDLDFARLEIYGAISALQGDSFISLGLGLKKDL